MGRVLDFADLEMRIVGEHQNYASSADEGDR